MYNVFANMKGRMIMLLYIKDRINDYNANFFLNELFEASKGLGALEAKIDNYQFDGILIPMLHKKEALSSMYIEGTQTTINDAFESEVNPNVISTEESTEISNHMKVLMYGAEHLRNGVFTHIFIKKLHEILMTGLLDKSKQKSLGKYKMNDNKIVNSAGTTIYTPPSHTETKRYMDELIDFINEKNDGINPLIKAAIMHAQFESIHPFEDGNGRVGRILVSLYLYKAKIINFPFFYISEAISQDKTVYYNKLSDTRQNSYDEWIKYFLKKIIIQTENHITYINSLNELYIRTKATVQSCINSPKFDLIVENLFTHPVLSSSLLADLLNVSVGQAKRYLTTLVEKQVLLKNDWKKNTIYFFGELLDLARRI